MQITHRIIFGHRDAVDEELKSMNVSMKYTPLPGGGYLVYIDIEESHHAWKALKELARMKSAVDVCYTIFSEQEIRQAEWSRLVPLVQKYYPQPESSWSANPTNYEGACPACGAGFKQTLPFEIAKVPKLGKYDFVSLYWTAAVFCSERVWNGLDKHGIRGYRLLDVLVYRTKLPCGTIKQLLPMQVTQPGLISGSDMLCSRCDVCGIVKYAPHTRGYMRYLRTSLPTDVDVAETFEWFGSGHFAFREVLVSRKLANLILDNKWRGVDLKPILCE